jgi:hypothetical protein
MTTMVERVTEDRLEIERELLNIRAVAAHTSLDIFETHARDLVTRGQSVNVVDALKQMREALIFVIDAATITNSTPDVWAARIVFLGLGVTAHNH